MNFRTVDNPTRGCGHLKEGGVYLQGCPFSKDGCLPAFVEFQAYVPTLEGHFRGFVYVNGLTFLLTHQPKEKYRSRGYNQQLAKNLHKALGMDPEMPFSEIQEKLLDETSRFIERARHDKGNMRTTSMNFQGCNTMPDVNSQDLLMYVGETYYKTPDDFIEECMNLGFSKRIKMLPGCVWPGFTRIFFAHMRAIPDPDDPDDPKKAQPGVFGYSYVGQAIYVKKKKGKVPEKIIDLHKTGKLEIVEVEATATDDDGEEEE